MMVRYFITMGDFDEGFYFNPINGSISDSIIELGDEKFILGFAENEEYNEEEEDVERVYEYSMVNLHRVNIITVADKEFRESDLKKKEEIKQIYT